jgi:Flp pilus assembly pilin Flp
VARPAAQALKLTRPPACARVRAQNVLEYGLIMVSIAVLVLVGVNAFGHQLEPWFAALAGLISTLT